MIATFSKLKANYRKTHTNLQIALGDEYAVEFDHRKQIMDEVIKFERDLNSRSKELKKLFWQRSATDSADDREKVVEAEKIHRQTTADERSRDRAHALELVNLKLHRVSEAKKCDKEAMDKKLEGSARLAKEELLLCLGETPIPGLNISELMQLRADTKSHCHRFRIAFLELANSLGDKYDDKLRETENTLSERAQNKISQLTTLIGEQQKERGNLAQKERQQIFNSNRVISDQIAKDIKLRCDALGSRVGVDPSTMPDSQLLCLVKGLQHFEAEASKILDRVIEYSRCAVELSASGQLYELNELLVNTLNKKEGFILAVRQEVEKRDLSAEKIRNALGLKIKIPIFTGYDADLDIYSFRTQFEKLVTPYVQKPLLADTLKFNYLGGSALTVVKELRDIDEIWERLIKSYGNVRVLLQNKLGGLCKLGGLDKIHDDEKLIIGIYELVNVMSELGRLAQEHHIEDELYQDLGGLGKVIELIGKRRLKKFLRKENKDLSLNRQEVWNKISTSLERELKDIQAYVVMEKASQPLVSANTYSDVPRESDNSDT